MVNELMRSRVLVVLSSEAFETGLNRVVDLDTMMRQITRVWVQDAANLFIERVYGWLATELGANGVDIRVVTGAAPEMNGLAAMVRMDKVAMLPRMG